VRDRLLQLLREHHCDDGMTTAELAERMGRSTADVNAYLCKLAMYGYVHKISGHTNRDPRPHELNRWIAK
jgi:DNA-binding IclR family transcriptional regulator